MRSERGFTLLEILVALAILAIALTSGIKLMQGSINNQTHLKQRTLAQWVVLNQLTELQLNPQGVSAGEQSGSVQMADQEWVWRAVITQPDGGKVNQVAVTVALESRPDQVLIHQIGFVVAP